MNRWILLFILCGASLRLAAAEPASPAHAEESPLTLDAAAIRQLGIVTATVAPRTLVDELRAPGEVKANGYATTLVSPRIPAQVVRRHAKLGDAVTVGQALVMLSSVEVAEAQSNLIVSDHEWQRVKSLGAEAVSAKRYTESQVARDQARAKLRAYGIGEGEIATLLKQGSARANGEFALTAPQAGRLTTDDFLVGERIEPGKPLFTIVNESTIWVEAQLAPDAAERIDTGASVRVIAHDQSLTGTVVQLSHLTLEGSRTTPVRIEVANEGDRLHTGEFVEALIATSSRSEALAVPSVAIVQLQGQPSVFISLGNGHFEVRPVTAGAARGDQTVIAQGLLKGESVVVAGAYALKARLLKAQLGEGHAH
ncbi:MAG: efflux RND transporter periplasmic adaptor subunit [Tahibacter sp.]